MVSLSKRIVKIGTRGSKLAMVQAGKTASMMKQLFPDVDFQIIQVKTAGDQDQNTPLSQMGGTGVFVKELEKALKSGTIDIAVHSAKDLPSELPEGFTIAAVPERESVYDALISREGHTLDTLPKGSIIATGSPRRRALVKWKRRDLKFCEARGNVDTRLRKLKAGEFDAIILAAAGLRRLKLESEISETLSNNSFPPALGQGCIAIEVLDNDEETYSTVAAIDNRKHHLKLIAERSLLSRLGAGCASAVGGCARFEDVTLIIEVSVLDIEGENRIDTIIKREMSDNTWETNERIAVETGIEAAEDLFRKGAADLMTPENASDSLE